MAVRGSPGGVSRLVAGRLARGDAWLRLLPGDCSPWGAPVGPLYEDWYRVRQFGDLEALNEGAVAVQRRGVHDAAASLAAGGAGGVYRLLVGEPLPRVTHAYWFAKPGITAV